MSLQIAFVVGAILLPYLVETLADVLNLLALRPDLPAEFQDVYDARRYAASQEYLRIKTCFSLVADTCRLVVVLAVVFSRTLGRLDDLMKRFCLGPVAGGMLFLGAVFLGFQLFQVPFAAYRIFVIEERFGFNKMTLKTFLMDVAKGFLVTTLLGGPLLAGLLWLFEVAGGMAWVWAWLFSLLVQAVVTFLAPYVIMPLFNKYSPLEPGPLRSAVEAYVRSQGLQTKGVFVMDGSRRSSKTNAFFTGFGCSRRIVLFDTLLASHSLPEILAVVAHETGHFKKKHVAWALVRAGCATGLLLGLFSLLLKLPEIFRVFGFSRVSTHAGLIIFALISAPLLLFFSVVENWISRRQERVADSFAVKTIGDSSSVVSALKRLGADNLANLTPHPLKVVLDYGHPPPLERIRALTGSPVEPLSRGGSSRTSPSSFTCSVLILSLLLVVPGAAWAVWHVPGAVSRAWIVPEMDTRAATVGSCYIWPHGFGPTNLGIRVFSDTGSPAACEIVWAAEGEPLLIRFDSSACAKTYFAYLIPGGTVDPLPWEPRGGLVLETRRRAEGSADTWEQAVKVWRESKPVLGRSLVDSIFHGIHPHGPTRDFVAYYTGYLSVNKPGKYSFATMSDDASFLLINSKIVAMWPGWHDVHGGRHGQHNGTVELRAGQHKIEYFNIQAGEGFNVVAAWKPPDRDRFEVIPSEAFIHTARYVVEKYDTPPGQPTRPCVAWVLAAHAQAGDLCLVNVRLRVLGAERRTRYVWRFDDGTQVEGEGCRHVFPATGLRTIRLEAFANGRPPSSVTERVSVHPVWEQRTEWPERVYERQREELMSRDFVNTPPSDLEFLVSFALRIEDRELATRLGNVCLRRFNEFRSNEAEMFHALGMHFQHHTVREYNKARNCFETALALAPTNSATHSIAAVHLAGLLLHCFDDPGAAQSVLGRAVAEVLPPVERRLRQIYEGDIFLASGRIEAARRTYLEAGTTADRNDRNYVARRRARLETARTCLLRQEYDEAERLVREIEWETPIERLDTETGLIMIQVHLARQEYEFAYAHCQRLLKAATVNRHTPDLLFCLVETCSALKKNQEAALALGRLFAEFPYSEATARAREKWSFLSETGKRR